MVKVSKSTAEQNRRALTEAAGRLFKERGVDAVGVIELSRSAGLSQGALYSKFESKRDLLVDVVQQTFARKQAEAMTLGNTPSLDDLLALHLSRDARDEVATGCGLVAWASEVRRWDAEAQAAFTEGFETVTRMYGDALRRADDPDAAQRALATVAAIVGGLSLARSVQLTDPGLSDAVVESVAKMLREYLGASRAAPDAAPRDPPRTDASEH